MRSPRTVFEQYLAAARAVEPPGAETNSGVAWRAARRYLDDGMVERAPTIAYYGILSVFPWLLISFALIRLVGGGDAPTELAEYARDHGASGAITQALQSALETAREAPSPGAGIAGVIGVITLIYGASRAFTAAGRALDAVGRRRPVPRSPLRRVEDIGWTLLLLVLTMAAIAVVLVSGRVLGEVLGWIGISGVSVWVWRIARIPLAALLAVLVIAVARYAAPTGKRAAFRAMTTGTLVSLAILALETIGFAIYVTHFAEFNATYGASAGAIILLLWIWLAAVAFLYGAEVDAVINEERHPPPPAAAPPSAG